MMGSPASMPHAVLWDMDGTLVDTEGLWLASEHQVMGALGASWTDEDQVICLGGPLERVTAHMRERSATDLDDDAVGQMLLDAMEGRLRNEPLEWRPGARELLLECTALDLPTALVSASWARLITAVVEGIETDLGFPPFATIVAGDDVRNSKPHPEPYLEAARRLGTTASDCLALEDSPTGITSARDAGCAVIAIPQLATVAHLGTAVVETLAGSTIGGLWATARTSAG